MTRTMMIAAASVAMLFVSYGGGAQAQNGDAGEARAMLLKAVAAVKADKAKALDMFNKGEGGFLVRDIYPYCINVSDGKLVATQIKPMLGTDARTLVDSTGKHFGQELFDAFAKAKDGDVVENTYLSPKPGANTTPAQKIAYNMKAGDLYCGVGYYK